MIEVEEILNQEQLLNQVDHDRDFLGELVEMFLEDYPHSLARIEEAISQGDAETVQHVSHSLKGALANFYAPLAYQAAQELEQAGKNGNLAHAPVMLERLKREVERVKTALLHLTSRVVE